LFRIVVVGALITVLVVVGGPQLHRLGGRYILRDHDHEEVMTCKPAAAPAKILRVLFVGNSLTFVNDLPAMLVNIAASDRTNTTRLEVKAETYPGANLNFMLTKFGALAWAQAHHVDYVVLQERSGWYETSPGFYEAKQDAADWRDALLSLNETPILFQVWADGAESVVYSDRGYAAFGKTVEQDANDAAESTQSLGREFGLPVVAVGQALARAMRTAGAPDVVGPDHHHPSVAGTYLAALVFYRYFTKRSGAEATYRPWGMSAADAAMLVQLSAE
jgi:hypothetical protein